MHLRPRARGGEVLPRARGRRGAAALPLQRHGLLRGRATGGCRSSRSRGTARRASGCRSRSGGGRSTPTTRTAPGSRSTPTPCARLERAQGRARACRPSTRVARRAARASEEGRCERAAREPRLARCSTRATRSTPTRPGATKNATPTPFGIVYPPAYADAQPDHVRPPAARVRARRRAGGRGRRHGPLPAGGGRAPRRRVERRLELRRSAGRRARRRRGRGPSSRSRASRRSAAGRGCAPSRSTATGAGGSRACVHNTTEVDHDRGRMERAEAPRSPACSRPTSCSRPRAGASSRRWSATGAAGAAVAGCESVNTFPVLASPGDDAVLGGADRPPRPSADGAREPRQPVRQHRDRGGAAAARPGALGRRARGRSPRRTRRCGR